jgi:hypothetical protein
MGFSGMKGEVYHMNAHCPHVMDGTAPNGDELKWADEVTRFVLTESVAKREFGHDKSFGFQDVVTGTRAAEVTLDAVSRFQYQSINGYHAGMIMYLILYPFGADNANESVGCSALSVSGYFMVERVSVSTDLDRGDPVSYTMTLTSHGPLFNKAIGNENWGGFECGCDTAYSTGGWTNTAANEIASAADKGTEA